MKKEDLLAIAVIDQVIEWQSRPLDAIYPIVYLTGFLFFVTCPESLHWQTGNKKSLIKK